MEHVQFLHLCLIPLTFKFDFDFTIFQRNNAAQAAQAAHNRPTCSSDEPAAAQASVIHNQPKSPAIESNFVIYFKLNLKCNCIELFTFIF